MDVSNHCEEMFGQGPQHSVVYRHGFQTHTEGEEIERHMCYIALGVCLFQGLGVNQLDDKRWFHMSHVQLGVQEHE